MSVHYSQFNPTETSECTQVCYGREVIGVYWHLPNGFQRTAERKSYKDQRSVKLDIINEAIVHTESKLVALKEELRRINSLTL